MPKGVRRLPSGETKRKAPATKRAVPRLAKRRVAIAPRQIFAGSHRVDAFLADIASVYKKHGLMLEFFVPLDLMTVRDLHQGDIEALDDVASTINEDAYYETE